MSVQDQRVICYLIASGIKNHASDEMPEEVEGSVVDLAQACGIVGHDLYAPTKAAIKSLIGHVIEFKDPDDGHEIYTSWLAEGHYYVSEGRFRCRFAPALRTVLTDLHKHRTEMDLETLLGLGGGGYAHRLYVICKSWESERGFVTSIDKLRDQLGVQPGTLLQLCHFRQRALDYPLQTINSKSDILVSYAKHGQGRKWTSLAFTIKSQKAGLNRATARVVDPKNPQQIDDLPADEQLQAWEWIKTKLVAGSDLPEKMDWSLLKMARTDALKHWIAEKNQAKFPFAN